MKNRVSTNLTKLLLSILLLGSTIVNGQTSMGKTFWMTFMESIGAPDTIQELKIVIACEKACTGTVQNYISGKTLSFSIGNGGGIDTVLLPATMCYNTGSETSSTKNRGILIQANDEVSVSAQNSKPGSCEAALIYSVESIGTYYRILSHMGDQSGNNTNYRSCFAIVATENNTIIDITPSVATSKGNTANTLFTITLQKGETYQVQSSTHRNDLSGTLVESRNCKKIAVFAGSTRSSVLYGSCTPSYSHLYEQMVPVNYWANQFIALPSIYAKGKQRKAEMIRVVASLNSTTVRCNGRLIVLSAGQSDTFFITSDAFIISNKPIGVCQYALSEACDPVISNTSPYMMWVPPVKQVVDHIYFASENAISVNRIFLNIIASTSETKGFRMNGTLVDPGWQKVSRDSNFSYTRLDSLPVGKHQISCPGGIISSLYAYGNHGSYGFMNSSSIDTLDFYALLNGKNSKDIYPGDAADSVCPNTSVSFNANTSNSSVVWKWIIHDSLGAVVRNLKSFAYTFKYSGTFKIMLIAQRSTPGLCNGQTTLDDTLFLKIHIIPKPRFEMLANKTKVCKDSFISVKVKNINWQNTSSFFWTFNIKDSVRNDTVISRSISKTSSFVFTLLDTNLCVGKDSLVIDPIQQPKVNLPVFNPICPGDSIPIMLTFSPPYYAKTIQWQLDGSLLPDNDSFYVFRHHKSATLTLSISDPYGCKGSDSSFITVFPKPVVDIISPLNYHYTDIVVLKIQKTFATYDWFNGHTDAIDSFFASDLGSPGKHTVWCTVTDSNGCVGTDTMDIFTDKLGIQNPGQEYIRMYPNPAGNELYIDLQTGTEIIIYGMDGKTIIRQTLKQGINTIDISGLEKGLYLLAISSARRILVKQ